MLKQLAKQFTLASLGMLALSLQAHNPAFLSITPTPNNGLAIKLHPNCPLVAESARDKSSLKLLLNKPQELLEQNTQALTQLTRNQLDCTGIKNLSETNPLCMFHECHAGFCSLNRKKHPKHRAAVEATAVSYLKKASPNKAEPIIYTSFGCGYMFSDIRVLSMLIKEGYTTIHINLIDRDFTKYIEIVRAQNHAALPCCLADDNRERGTWIAAHTCRFAQLLTWLNKSLNGTVTLHIYANMLDYLADCEANSNRLSSLVFGMDFLDEMNPDGLNDFWWLITHGLQKDGYAVASLDQMFEAKNQFMGIVKKTKDLPFSGIRTIFTDTMKNRQSPDAQKRIKHIETHIEASQVYINKNIFQKMFDMVFKK